MKHANVAIFVPHAGCPNRCSFCNQHTISGAEAPPDADMVRRVCEAGLQSLGEQAGKAEIAFFGGSFTAVPVAYQEELLSAAAPYVGGTGYRGIRLSTRPDCIDKSTLQRLCRYGVSAIELGCQSMDDEVLQKNLRGHTSESVVRASALIREAGLELGHQMMLGLWGDSAEKAWRTARKLATLGPDTMRIYPTVVLPGTLLESLYRAGEYHPLSLEKAVELGAGLLSFFEEKGIRVIRMGLHASETLGVQQVAGAYHPAYRELCENRIFLERFIALLDKHGQEKRRLTAYVAPGSISKAVGQRRRNLLALEAMGWLVAVRPRQGLGRYDVVLE